MTDREAVDFLKKAHIYWCTPRKNGKQVTMELYIEAMAKAINALEEKTMALPIPMSRPHGEWIWQTEDKYRCSVCGENTRVEEVMNEPQYNFCPNCGADMRKKEGEAE